MTHKNAPFSWTVLCFLRQRYLSTAFLYRVSFHCPRASSFLSLSPFLYLSPFLSLCLCQLPLIFHAYHRAFRVSCVCCLSCHPSHPLISCLPIWFSLACSSCLQILHLKVSSLLESSLLAFSFSLSL